MKPDKYEYESRYARARSLMKAQGLDALFVTDPANLFYFTGHAAFGGMSFPRPAPFLLPLEHDPILILHDFHNNLVWQGDVRYYRSVGALPVELLKDAFADAGCVKGHIGAELGREQQLSVSPTDFSLLRQSLPGADFVDAAGIFWQLRMVKSAIEVAAMRRACEIEDSIFENLFGWVRSGMTARDIEKKIRELTAKSDSEFAMTHVCFGPFDLVEQSGGSCPSDRILKAGDQLWIDFGVSYEGYRTDYCRAGVVGGASRAQTELWGKVQSVFEAGRNAVRPGTPVSDVYHAEMSAASQLGLDMSTWPAGRYGHGIGLHGTEPPYVNQYDHEILRPGMTIQVEPGVTTSDGVYVREEHVLVTDQGSELLSHAPWELRSI